MILLHACCVRPLGSHPCQPLRSHLCQSIGQSPTSDHRAVTCARPSGSHLCQTVKQSPVSDRRAVTRVRPSGSHPCQTVGQSPVSDRQAVTCVIPSSSHLCQTVKQSPVSDRRAVTPSGRKLPAHGVTTHVYRAGVVRIVVDRCGLSDGRYAAPVCTRSESVHQTEKVTVAVTRRPCCSPRPATVPTQYHNV